MTVARSSKYDYNDHGTSSSMLAAGTVDGFAAIVFMILCIVNSLVIVE